MHPPPQLRFCEAKRRGLSEASVSSDIAACLHWPIEEAPMRWTEGHGGIRKAISHVVNTSYLCLLHAGAGGVNSLFPARGMRGQGFPFYTVRQPTSPTVIELRRVNPPKERRAKGV